MLQQYDREQQIISSVNEENTGSSQTYPPDRIQKVTRRSILTTLGGASAALCVASISVGCGDAKTRLLHRFSDTARITSIAWSPDGTRIISGSFNFTAQIWDIATEKSLQTLHCEDVITAVAWSPDGTRIATGQWGKHVARVWDSTTGKLLATYSGPRTSNCVAWSPDNKSLAVGYAGRPGEDRMVKIWDTTTGKDTITYHNDSKNVLCVAWSPYDPNLVASGTDDNKVYIQRINKETQSNTNALTYRGHGDSVQKVVWSPETVKTGHYIASGSGNYDISSDPPVLPIGDTTVQIWDTATGKPFVYNGKPLVYKGHLKTVTALAWSPDGKYIASGSADGTVQVWHPFDGQLVAKYTGHSGDVNAVAWSPDNKYIASGGADGTVQVWQFNE